MRAFLSGSAPHPTVVALVLVLFGCSAATTTTTPRRSEEPPHVVLLPSLPSSEPVDVIATLSRPMVESSSILAAALQLTSGGATLDPLGPEELLEVDLLEQRGPEVRVGVRLEHVRFAAWMPRARLLRVLSRDQRVSDGPGRAMLADGAEVLLHAGSRVRVLTHKQGWTKILYLGALEIEGWVPDDALVERGPAGRRVVRKHLPRRKPLMVIRGSAIRAAPRREARVLAASRHSHIIDQIGEKDQGWNVVGFEDSDVVVRGFSTKRAAPVAIHYVPERAESIRIDANATVPAGTCLYADDEPVGLVATDARVYLEPSHRVGWFDLTTGSPWGPITFGVRGSIETDLATCGDAKP